MRTLPAPTVWRALLPAIALVFAAALPLRAAVVDLNANGFSDVWEYMFGATGIAPDADSDGDGLSNAAEASAGTNPFDPDSVPRLSVSLVGGTNISVSMPCALGKQYQLQSIQPGDSTDWSNWTTEATLVVRSGSVVTFNSPATPAARFFRIAIADVDSDGDGVNDWEEYQLGLDPLDPTSNNQLDADGHLMTDYAYVTGKLASQNVLTITALDPTANQPDPGQSAVNLGIFVITRGGFALNPLRVNLALGAPGPGVATEGVDYVALPRLASLSTGISGKTIPVTPLPNTNLQTPVLTTVKLLPGTGYTIGTASNASVLIYPSASPAGTGLTGQYYTNSSATYSNAANFNPPNLRATRVDPVISFNWSNSTTLPITNTGGYYSVRWTGQVQPQYSETYFFDVYSDDGVKLWINDQLVINGWTAHGPADSIGSIALQAGVKYDLRLEYFNIGGGGIATLSWYSATQSKQVIPANRLYPATNAAPAAITSPLNAFGFLGQPFSFTVTGANGSSGFTAANLPPGLNFNPATGVISGMPNLAGDYQVLVTATNATATAASIVDIQVIDTGTSVVREVWLNVPGTTIADIPLSTTPPSVGTLGTLEGITDYGDNYAERIRGYFTAPSTGNYYFWLAGSDAAELWISNDREPANKVRRAFVSSATAPRQWTAQPNQRSGWLTLQAGQAYYLEVLHKAGAGAGDNWSVGWLQDATGTNFNVNAVVPGFLLSRYYPLPPAAAPGALYTATLLPVEGVTNMPVGSASLRLSADGSHAVLNFSLSGISSGIIGEHILNDPYLNNPGQQILFDISASNPQVDGSYNWGVEPVGTLSAADVLAILNGNKAYIAIYTANYPNGEVSGHFSLVSGSSSFTAPPTPPVWTDDHSSSNAAARFLIQATFGPTASEVANVLTFGYDGWLSNQFALPPSHHLPVVLANVNPDPSTPYSSTRLYNTWWRQSVTAPDQLRQRVAFALSEIMVVSQNGILADRGTALSYYYDTLLDNAFGNYRALLKAVTLTPTMGLYLDMRGNDKGNITTGIHANENYAREILQLFSIGLYRLWPDGTLVLSSQGTLVPTYDQNVIMGFASTFTGWNYYQPFQTNGHLPTSFSPSANYTNPMVLVPTHHELGTKLLLDNVMLPPAWGTQTFSTNSAFDSYGLQDLEQAMDSIYNNPNVGPFICRQLIQRLVTSTPSSDYLYRVVQVFNNNGAGVRGDLQAVIRAILLDYEARSPVLISKPTFGKQREPLLRATAVARAFPAPAPITGTYGATNSRTVTVTTSSPHRLGNNDVTWLSFAGPPGTPAPPAQAYTVTTTGSNTFTVSGPGLSAATYVETPNLTLTNVVGTTTNVFTANVIMVSFSGHGLVLGNSVYLAFTSGGASNGVYQVLWLTNNNYFAVTALDAVARSGNCVVPKYTGGGYTQSRTNVTVSLTLPHGLSVGDSVFVNFTAAGSPADGVYPVATVPDATHFTIVVGLSANQTQNGQVIYPLVPPPLTRSGDMAVNWSTWSINGTDSGSGNGNLLQTPLNSPTVFNYFYPDYRFPGPLTTAGLTTPEFQLTSDTGVALQMNFLEGALLNNTGNTNGPSSFIGGGGALYVDLGPWMMPGYTSNSGLSGLVDALSSLLTGGPLAPGVKTAIINYAQTLPYTTPTATQMRDRARAVVHLLVTSPDFTIQK